MNPIIIIPVYNEQENIAPLIREIRKQFPRLDVVVVDDHSTDATAQILSELQVPCIRHSINLGYGTAVQTGYKYALQKGYTAVIQLDGDGQHDPAGIGLLWQKLRTSGCDIVIGTRFWSKSPYQMDLWRQMGVRIQKILLRLLCGLSVSDPTSGFLALSEKALELFSKNWFPFDYPDADVLLVARRLGLNVTEQPVVMRQSVTRRSMHSGLRPLYYMFRIIFVMLLFMFQDRRCFLED